MKILKILSILLVVVSLTGCTSDDGSPIDTNASANDLVGVWTLTEESQDGVAKVTIEGVTLNGTITSTSKNLDATLTITENPNTITAAGSYTEVITASFATLNRTEEVLVDLDNELNQGAWSLSNGVLTLLGGSETLDVNIIELTSTTLRIEIPIERDVVLEGTDVAIDTTIKMTFTKQ